MKCGIITFHRAINYGAVLQVYALVTVLKKMGIDTEVIDYYCPVIEELYRPSRILNKKVLKHFIASILYNGTLSFNNSGFADFRKLYLQTSATKYNSLDELKECNNQYDLLITGSDQVWSPTCASMDLAYFLSFADQTVKKAAYAASFGVQEIPEMLKKKYTSLLNGFDFITVRESSGAIIVKELCNKDVSVVLDPTLLLNREEWMQQFNRKKTIKEPYILIYTIGENKSLLKTAIEKGKELGHKIYYINDRLYKIKGVENLRGVSPEEWFWLIEGAELVYTNSFHGLTFCTNLKKKFYIQKLTGNAGANTRLGHFISKFNLQCFTFESSIHNDVEPSYPEDFDEKMQRQRDLAFEYLLKIINSTMKNSEGSCQTTSEERIAPCQ